MKVINTVDKQEDKPIATDEECQVRRNILISSGVVVPAHKSDLITKKDGSVILSTRKSGLARRKELIEKGLIDENLCQLLPNNVPYQPKEEGEYRCKSIRSEEEYDRRKRAYFRAMQEILHSRKELKLILGKKDDNDPEWYF